MAFCILQKSLHLSTKIIKNYCKIPNLSRTLTTSKSFAGNYEGDGKTIVTILNREYKHLILVNSYSNAGFRLSNGVFAMGPLAVFPRTILQWNVNTAEDITPETLSLFCLLEPKLDILVIGTGNKRLLLPDDATQYLKNNKITAEILSSEQACSVFNFLNTEGRCVAGAFIPPDHVVPYEDECYIMGNVEAIDIYESDADKVTK